LSVVVVMVTYKAFQSSHTVSTVHASSHLVYVAVSPKVSLVQEGLILLCHHTLMTRLG